MSMGGRLARRPWQGVVGVAATPALRSVLRIEVEGAGELSQLATRAILAANHASELDRWLIVSSLPRHRRGRDVLTFPEGPPSPDGFLRRFGVRPAELALRRDLPLVPVGLRGTYAALPPGRRWPVPGRPAVSVRFGSPLHAEVGETPELLTERLAQEVRALIEEDATTWWQVQRFGLHLEADPPPGSWRRIWLQSQPLDKQSAPPIWR